MREFRKEVRSQFVNFDKTNLPECPRPTHRPLSSSFLGLPYRILNINHKEELLRGLWVDLNPHLQTLECC